MILLQRVITLLLVVLVTAPGFATAETKTPDEIALATLDRFMAAFNDQDIEAWAATLNYPHVRFASRQVMIYDSAEAFQDRSIFPALAATGWHHSLWTKRTITLSSHSNMRTASSCGIFLCTVRRRILYSSVLRQFAGATSP